MGDQPGLLHAGEVFVAPPPALLPVEREHRVAVLPVDRVDFDSRGTGSDLHDTAAAFSFPDLGPGRRVNFSGILSGIPVADSPEGARGVDREALEEVSLNDGGQGGIRTLGRPKGYPGKYVNIH